MTKVSVACGIILSLALSGCRGHGGSGSSGEVTVVKVPEGSGGEVLDVVVKPFTGKALEPSEFSALEETFCTDVQNAKSGKQLNVKCPSVVLSMLSLQEDKIKFGSCEEEACLAEMGKATKASLILVVTIAQVGETYVVTANVADGETGKSKLRLNQEVNTSKKEDLLPALKTLADKLAAEL